MSDQRGPGLDGRVQERSTAHVILRYRPGTYTAEQLDELAERAERIARYIDKRLSSLTDPRGGPERITLSLESEPRDPAGSPDGRAEPTAAVPSVPVTPEPPVSALGQRLALAMIHQRFGGPDLWAPPADQADALAIAHALEFLAVGLARYLATEGEQAGHGKFLATPGGTVPRQSANQVCRQVAADRDGKVPLYECLMRGPDLASPPEYAALAESFCGYLFERDGPKAYRRFVRNCRQNPNAAADLVYGKTLEELQDEWLGAILRGQGRRPVALKAFARQVVPYLRPYTWLVILALMLMFLAAGVAQVAPFTVRDIIDILTAGAGKGDPDLISDSWQIVSGGLTGGRPDLQAFLDKHALAFNTLGRLYTKIVILMLAVFVNLCAIIWLVYVVNVIGNNVMRDLRVQFTARLHHLGAGFYARHRMGDMLSRFTSDIARMADPLADATAYSIYYLISLVATIGSMVVMSWQLSCVLFLIVPIYLVINRKFGPAMQGAARTRQERLAQLNAGLEEMLFGNGLIKAYGLGGHMMRRFQPRIGEYRKVGIWSDFLAAIYKEVIGIAENAQTKLVFAVGGTLVVFGQITTGTIIGFNTLAGRFITPLHRLGLIYASVAMASASLRRVEEILRQPIESMDVPPGGTYAPEDVDEALTFERVSFSYTGAEPTLLDINLRIPAGAHVAFVGPTGAGKSTLVNLIPRFYDVDQGAVKIDGRDIRSFALAGLRQSISIVSQDTFVFNSTVMENIRLGRLDASDAEVIEAAKGASLHDFIESLPAGYDTLVGERGSRLSGGQKQRVSIARALLRNSPILILDEATSALDAETESEILAELDEVTRGKTVISITHRLGLAIKSDEIYVLQAGRVVQQGSHETLIQETGLYRKLFEDQNRDLMRRSVAATDSGEPGGGPAPIFSMVPADQIARLAHLPRIERYPAGDVFCKQNGANGKHYLLHSGQVELTMHDEQGGEQRLSIGAPAGQNGSARMALLLNIPHTVSARALTETEVGILDDGDLRPLLGNAWPTAAPLGDGEAANGGSASPVVGSGA